MHTYKKTQTSNMSFYKKTPFFEIIETPEGSNNWDISDQNLLQKQVAEINWMITPSSIWCHGPDQLPLLMFTMLLVLGKQRPKLNCEDGIHH